MVIYAHSLDDRGEDDWERLACHLKNVGARAAIHAAPFGAAQLALAMGLLHDIGKCSVSYQEYIRRPVDGKGTKGPDHSTAGAQRAVEIYGRLVGRLLSFGIAGHHGGLMNGDGHEGGSLTSRLGKTVEQHDGWQTCTGALPKDLQQSMRPPRRNDIDAAFSLPFLARMLFSCLVDADFLETEAFYSAAEGGDPPERGGRLSPDHVQTTRAFLARHRRDDTDVNRLRSRILDHANARAGLEPGLFTLTVPTGGGKTLTSLSFAMEHAAVHDLRRIVYVIPFTSIIEQTASVFRDDVGLGDAVLEHHASFDWDQRRPASDDSEHEGASGLEKLRRSAENWDAPVVVTTAVQFFESLFAARTGRARKLHNLAKSVIILDEAQSIPVHLLRPCLAVIEELAKNYGASLILCTATQPALRRDDAAMFKGADKTPDGLVIPEDRELAPDPARLYERLRRVKVEWRRDAVTDAELVTRFAKREQMLCIVNSRNHARLLFSRLREEGQDGAVHLTTLMCARHRQDVLEKIRGDLAHGRDVRLVATSLIEAGVDISFPEVWRAAAGLPSLAQAAGRCNRSGELGPLGEAFGRVVLFEPAEHRIPDAINAFYAPARTVLRQERADPLGLEAVREYYRELYWRKGEAALDAATLEGRDYPILKALADTQRGLAWPFADIARAFRMIDQAMDPVIVPFDDEAAEAIAVLRGAPFPPRAVVRRLQRYVVPVPSRVRLAMIGVGAVQCIRPDVYGDRFAVLENRSLYDEQSGLRLDDPSWRAGEDNIF
ncbi:MAG: CRISPR-associated endonuclease Cas3'' [Gluconacetobacter sp.]|uniref:CRISPR-associated endonuclease Cas3 n=1 Tax=Gluconacetobacter dulcium TaxID=2729096 RepID=A0A7W4JWZ7_9PROT|nr:CRISPR-associated endonuclease Cas3'' [Gluconacetobacter dulcium]